MIAPGSMQDWVMGAGVVGTLIGFAAIGHRWMLSDTEISFRDPVPELRDFPALPGLRASLQHRAGVGVEE
jgi:hypothetical protein